MEYNNMWIFRSFKTKENMEKFLDKNFGKIQWVEVFINNGYAIEYRKLRRIY
jgi:hypothetical protein